MRRLGSMVIMLAFCGIANGAVLKIATLTPEGSEWMVDMRAGAKEIATRTEGRVQIKYYGGGIMGNDAKVLAKIRIGNLQGGALTPIAVQALYPDINLPGLPMMFRSEAEAAYVRGYIDERLQAGLEEAGFVSFGFATAGFAIIMSNEPVRKLSDLKGKRVWVPEGDTVSYDSMASLSLAPVILPMTDVLTGLQTGLIDIVAISPVGALILQWHTKIKFITDMPLVYTLGFMAIEKKAFYKLSEGDQMIVREVMTRTYESFDKANLMENRAALDALLKTGIEMVSPDEQDFIQINDALQASNRMLGERGDFSIEMYDEILRLLQDYRREHGAEVGQ